MTSLDDWYDLTSPNNASLHESSCLRYLSNAELTSLYYALCKDQRLEQKQPEYIRQELQEQILNNTQFWRPDEETVETAREFISSLPPAIQFATIPEVDDAKLLRALNHNSPIKVTRREKKPYEREPLFPEPDGEATNQVKKDTITDFPSSKLFDTVEGDSGLGKEGEQTETITEITKNRVSKKVRFFESELEENLKKLHLRAIERPLIEDSTYGEKFGNTSSRLQRNLDRPKYIFERGTAVRRKKSRLGTVRIKHTLFQQPEDNNFILESIASISSEAASLVQTFNENKENKKEGSKRDFNFEKLFFDTETSGSRDSLSTINSGNSGSSGSITDFLKIEYPKESENEEVNTPEGDFENFDNPEVINNQINMNFGALLRPSIYRHGQDEDIKTFLEKFENEADANEWTEEVKLRKIKIAFDGPAHDIYIGKVKSVPGLITWPLMKAKLEDVYKRSKTELKEKLKHRTYKGENDWSEYMLYIKRIVREIDPLASEEKIIKKVIQGLPLKERDFILREKPQTMHALDRAFLAWLKYKESMEEGKGRELESKVEQLEKKILQLNEGSSNGKQNKGIGNVNKNKGKEEPLTLTTLLQTLQNNPELFQKTQPEMENTGENGEEQVEINYIGQKSGHQQGRGGNNNFQRGNSGYQGQNRYRNRGQEEQNYRNNQNYNYSDRNYQGNYRGNYRGRDNYDNRYQGQRRNQHNYNQHNDNGYRNDRNNRRYEDRRYDNRKFDDRRYNDDRRNNGRNNFSNNNGRFQYQNMQGPPNGANFTVPPPYIPHFFNPPPFQPPPFFGPNGDPNQGQHFQKN